MKGVLTKGRISFGGASKHRVLRALARSSVGIYHGHNHACVHLTAKRCEPVRNGNRESSYCREVGDVLLKKQGNEIFAQKSVSNNLIKDTSGHILIGSLVEIYIFS